MGIKKKMTWFDYLLILIILNVVFSKLFQNRIENFPVYLCAGRVMFTFVTSGGRQ